MLEFNPLKDPCLTCGLWKDKKNPCIRPAKETKHGLVAFIGEAPGENEDKLGSVFVGRSGEVLHTILARLNVSRYVLLNAVACRPTTSKGGNRTPNAREVQLCSTFLKGDLERLAPRVVICLGRIAASAFGLSGSLRDLRNREWRVDKHTWTTQEGVGVGSQEGERDRGKMVPCFVTYHPAASLRPGQAHLRQVIEEDIALYLGMREWKEYLQVIDGARKPGSPEGKKSLTREAERGILSIEGGEQEKYLVVDIENDGFLKGQDPFPFGDKGRKIWVIGTDQGRVQGLLDEPEDM